MYRYSGCVWPFPHRLTGDGHKRLMSPLPESVREYNEPAAWTDGDVEYLIEMYRKNLSFPFIADVLERSLDSIRVKVKRLRQSGVLPYRGNIQHILSEKRREYIRRNYPKYGIEYCARHLGFSLITVEEYVKKMRLKVA